MIHFSHDHFYSRFILAKLHDGNFEMILEMDDKTFYSKVEEDGKDDLNECKVGRSPQHQVVQVALSSAKSR